MKISGVRLVINKGMQVSAIAAIALSVVFVSQCPAALRHNYLFNSGDGTTVVDSVAGGLNGTAMGGTIDTADSRFVLDGADNFIDFNGAALALNTYSSLTLELWSLTSPVHEGQYTCMACFGGTNNGTGVNYIMMQPSRGGVEGSSGQIIDVATNGEARVTGPVDLADGKIHHTVLTISGTEVNYYVDGGLVGTQPLGAPSLSGVSTQRAHLGDSVWDGDPLINGAIYEFRVYDDIKSTTDVANLFAAGCQAGCGNLYLEVNRSTGAATLFNALSTKDMVIYQIASAKGALNSGNWLSVTENYDEDDGGEFDMDDQWQIVSQTNTLLHELDPIGQGAEDGGAFGQNTTIPLGNIWTKSPFEDLQVTMTILDANLLEQQLAVPVFFIGGPNNARFSRSDIDVDGDIDAQDYSVLKVNHLKPLVGTLHIDTFSLGDINGDLLNDYRDFRLFKADFVAENGAAAFASLLASSGAIPEPSSLLLLICGTAAGVLSARRKSHVMPAEGRMTAPKRQCEITANMIYATKVLLLFAFLTLIPSLSRAQAIVISETFDTRIDTTPFPPGGGATLTLVEQGGGDQALQMTATTAGGFFGPGFTIDTLEVEPGPGGQNLSSILSDYRLSFDLTINAIGGFTPNLEIWLADGPRFSTNNANLYTASGLVNGVNNISFTLNQNLTTTTPNGFASPGGAWSPTADNWWVQINAINFNAPANASVDYTIDNFQVTAAVAPTLALVVDPASGKARIRNVSGADLTFDYYRIESNNGSLLTANYNGTTGWNSLDDQNFEAIGGGVGESWEEVSAANSANRLIEQYLAGATTLLPGQSIAIGAPINPSILNNNLSSLAFRIGGEEFVDVAIAQVLFETINDALVGDYNQNGKVDAADYTLWRDRIGQPSSSLPNRDPANTGNISTADYNSWKTNFGMSLGSGSGQASMVPEPSAAMLFVLAMCCGVWASNFRFSV